MGRFARCKCFLDSNVYVKNIGHLVFKNEAQFIIADYGDAGPSPIKNFNSVLHEVLVLLLIISPYTIIPLTKILKSLQIRHRPKWRGGRIFPKKHS